MAITGSAHRAGPITSLPRSVIRRPWVLFAAVVYAYVGKLILFIIAVVLLVCG
jgi:hypothetical protein